MSTSVMGSWITNNTKKPFYARKKFTLEEKPQKAKIAICGLGQFNLFVNGKKVGDHVMDPAWTDYNKLVDYLVFDIAEYLQAGENVIGAEVGNGWYIMETEGGYSFHFPPFMPPNPNPYKPFGSALVLAARCLIGEGEDVIIIDTDESWEVAPHKIVISNCYGSEVVDGRMAIENWSDASCTFEGWEKASLAAEKEQPQGELDKQFMPAVKVIGVLEGKFLGRVNGRLIYDFGINVSGLVAFSVKGKSGQVVKAFPAEKLGPDGDVDQMAKNWILIDVCDTYIIGKDDTWEHFENTFTYAGARYVAIEGIEEENLKDVEMKSISSAGENAGEFWCDDERYMQIYKMIQTSVEANMVGVHTDCPTIERFAWQEENHLMAPSIMYMKKVDKHWIKFLKDTRYAQHTMDDRFLDMAGNKFNPGQGLIPSQAPCYIPNVLPVPGMGSFYDIIGWGSTVFIAAWLHYRFYGDRRVLEECYEAGKLYLEHLKGKVNEEGFINHGLGDWGNPIGEFARENIETVYLFGDAIIMAEASELLGKTEEAADYRAYAKTIQDNYNSKLLIHDEKYGWCYKVWNHPGELYMTQAAEAMPLYFKMVPDYAEADVAANLRRIVEEAGSFVTGEVGQPYIINTMANYGMNDLICQLITKPEHPSYYAFILAGETSLGEYWEDNPRSHNHDMMGHIIEWYYNNLAGIKPLAPGFKKVLVKPYLPASINELKCSYESASGLITVAMKRENGEIKLDVTAADGIDLTIDRSSLK